MYATDSMIYFNPAWEEYCLFIDCDELANCVICLKEFHHMKKCNLEQHHFSHHAKTSVKESTGSDVK
jgi:hypothetical protein